VDSHVHFTDEWVKARLRKEMQAVWDEANKKAEDYAAKVLRGGQPQLSLEDFVDPEAAMDPGHFEPHAKLKAMDRDGVYAEVIFPELAGAKIANPHLMGNDWKEVFQGYNNAMGDFLGRSSAPDDRLPAAAVRHPLRGEGSRAPGARQAGALRADHSVPLGPGPAGRLRQELRAAVGGDPGQ